MEERKNVNNNYVFYNIKMTDFIYFKFANKCISDINIIIIIQSIKQFLLSFCLIEEEELIDKLINIFYKFKLKIISLISLKNYNITFDNNIQFDILELLTNFNDIIILIKFFGLNNIPEELQNIYQSFSDQFSNFIIDKDLSNFLIDFNLINEIIIKNIEIFEKLQNNYLSKVTRNTINIQEKNNLFLVLLNQKQKTYNKQKSVIINQKCNINLENIFSSNSKIFIQNKFFNIKDNKIIIQKLNS